MSKGWIGVDFDRTLAHYENWVAADHCGDPIGPMLERVKEWLAEGREVRVFTARVSSTHGEDEVLLARTAIELWCEKHLARRLVVTCEKDGHMDELWDDRAIQVEPNDGRVYEHLAEDVQRVEREHRVMATELSRLRVNNATLADLVVTVGKSFGLPAEGFTVSALIAKMHELHDAFRLCTEALDVERAKVQSLTQDLDYERNTIIDLRRELAESERDHAASAEERDRMAAAEITCPKCGQPGKLGWRGNVVTFPDHACVAPLDELLALRTEIRKFQQVSQHAGIDSEPQDITPAMLLQRVQDLADRADRHLREREEAIGARDLAMGGAEKTAELWEKDLADTIAGHKAALSELSSAITRGTHKALSVKEMLALIADDHNNAERVRHEFAEYKAETEKWRAEDKAERDREDTVNAKYITEANARASAELDRACKAEAEIADMRKRMLAALGVTEATALPAHEKVPTPPTYAELEAAYHDAEAIGEEQADTIHELETTLAEVRRLFAELKDERDKLHRHATLPVEWNGMTGDAGRVIALYMNDMMSSTTGEKALCFIAKSLIDAALNRDDRIDELELEVNSLRNSLASDPHKRIAELNITVADWVGAAKEIYRAAGRPPIETTSPNELRGVVVEEVIKPLAYYKSREKDLLGQLGAWRALRGGKPLEIVFDGPPGAQSGRFVECEIDGRSVTIGEWTARPDGLTALVLPLWGAQRPALTIPTNDPGTIGQG